MYVTSPVSIFNNSNIISTQVSASNESQPQIINVSAGHPLFFEGDEAEFVYEMVEGVVRTSKILFDGRRQILSFGYPGDVVGLSHDRFYHCDCETVCDVKLRVHRKNASNTCFERDPNFCNELLRYAACEVNNMQEHFIMLGRKSAMEKVASFLAALMGRVGEKKDSRTCFDIPMCRSDIADFLGLSHETISRTLTRLRQNGIIDLPNKHRVCVRRPSELKALAERE
ncbi:helix-turn-helix domain-containing protein [Hoeflea sp. TYP-13]|uniref:helix-turn-helix domain-containing protein n=1 Tax=Hoeflea sp. TYP-13 TaxID=3230023 RepID=UPI0034C62F7A